MNPGEQNREPKQQGYVLPLIRDLVSVSALAILLICIHDFATPFHRGFYCDDETIRYPHKDSTVPSSVCYLVGSGINVVLILIFEYHLLIQEERRNSTSRGSRNDFQLKLYLRNVYCRLVVWLFGAISSELLTDISKFTAGRLRPHFIDVCRPVVKNSGDEYKLDQYCSDPSSRFKYVLDYQCSGPEKMLRDIRLSFMSGHSSYAAYSATYAVFYLQSVMDVAKLGLVKPTLQVLIISAAFYTGLTRVSDYKHHWQDVLAGLLQGASVATVVSLYLYPAFYKTYTKFMRNTGTRVGESLSGEELNRVSY